MNPLKLTMAVITLPVVAGLLLAACGGNTGGTRPAVGSVPSSQERSSATPRGPVAPDFIVSTGVGSAFSLAEHKGDVVVLYFSFPG